MASRTSMASGDGNVTPRRQRYTRASTASVTQLLSDSYSNLMNRLTRRGPSEKADRLADASLSAARTRYDDKLLSNKDGVLSSVRRYENKTRLSPYNGYTTGNSLKEDRSYSGLSGVARSRPENSPLRPTTTMNTYGGALGKSDSFRTRSRLLDNSSPSLTKRYPLRETNNNIDSTLYLGSTRSRLEDKYSSVLDKIASEKKEREKRQKEDRDKTLEPEQSMPRSLMRSLTTAVFGEKSYNSNLNYSREKTRDKTPYRNTADRRLSSYQKTRYDRDLNKLDDSKTVAVNENDNRSHGHGKERNSIYRRHQRRSLRVGKSETDERKAGKLAIHPIDIADPATRDLVSPTAVVESIAECKLPKTPPSSPTGNGHRQKQLYFPNSDEEDDDKTPTADPAILERENRRKEIQSLIMKYAALDEVYGRMDEKKTDAASNSVATVTSANKPEPLVVGDVVALPPEIRSKHRPQRPRHQLRRAATPPVSSNHISTVAFRAFTEFSFYV